MEQVNATKRTDLFRIDPRNIEIKDGYNIRKIDVKSPDMLRLIQSIKENGVKRPLVVKLNPDKDSGKEYLCIDGHRRLHAILQLIEQGENIAYVKCELASKMNEEEVVISMFTLNDGEPLSLTDRAEGVRRLITVHGLTASEVAEKLSESAPTISNLLKLSGMPSSVKKAINKKIISPTLALEIARACETEEDFVNEISNLVASAEASEDTGEAKQGKRAAITAKKVKNIVGEKNVVKLLDKVNEDIKSRFNGEKATFFEKLVVLLKNKPKQEQIIQLFEEYAATEKV